MNICDFVDLLPKAKKTPNGWESRCPAHDDRRQSLSIKEGQKGIALFCHAGCGVRDIAASLGLKMADLFYEPLKTSAQAKAATPGGGVASKIVATYDYKDEKGALLFQVVRFEPKDFRQRSPDPDGKDGWTWKTAGVRRVLWRLPELIAALKRDPASAVFIVEGEKDVLSLEKQGAVATCNPGGAGKWVAGYNVALHPAQNVVIVADRDEPGRKHARAVCAALARPGRRVVVVEVPDGKDVSEYFAKGGTAAALLDLAAAGVESQPASPATAQPVPVGVKEGELPPCHYDLKRQRFFIPSGKEWIPVNETRVNVQFKSAGFSEFVKDSLGVSVLERAIQRVVVEKNVSYAGPVAGYWPGAATMGGRRVLVTTGPRLVTPKKGEWPILQKLLEELLLDPSYTKRQGDLLVGWIAASYAALTAGTFRPGLALMLCGLADCGKTVLQGIIAEILGGRTANPYAWLIGQTNFNAELLASEVLVMDDDAAERDLKSRQQLGQRVKQLLVAGTMRIEGKGIEAFEARPFTRLIGCLNSAPQDLMILPPMDEGVREKFLLLKISPGEFPDTPEAFQKMRAQISAELPAFLWWALNVFKLPAEYHSNRFGVQHWQHPDLMFDLEDLHPWRRLMELIDYVQPWTMENDGGDGNTWQGGVQDLNSLLLKKENARASAVLRSIQCIGMDLKAAQNRLPNRIGDRKINGHKVWIIRRQTNQE